MRTVLAAWLVLTFAACVPESAAPAASEEALFEKPLEDRASGDPILDASHLEVVAELPYPPGNVAVSPEGRVFFSFIPQGNRGDVKVAELAGGEVVPFPSLEIQAQLRTVLGLRIDRLNRLWLLDYGGHGYYRPKLYGIDLDTDQLVVEYAFPSNVAPLGSMLNDLQVSHDGTTIFISDSSIIGGSRPGSGSTPSRSTRRESGSTTRRSTAAASTASARAMSRTRTSGTSSFEAASSATPTSR